MCSVRTGTIGRWENCWKYVGPGGRQVGLAGGAVAPQGHCGGQAAGWGTGIGDLSLCLWIGDRGESITGHCGLVAVPRQLEIEVCGGWGATR